MVPYGQSPAQSWSSLRGQYPDQRLALKVCVEKMNELSLALSPGHLAQTGAMADSLLLCPLCLFTLAYAIPTGWARPAHSHVLGQPHESRLPCFTSYGYSGKGFIFLGLSFLI